jgi:uncharacterized membrane protein YuzA (DUF378 family)
MMINIGLYKAFASLVIVGALQTGFIGLIQRNVLGDLLGLVMKRPGTALRVIYSVIGIAAIAMALTVAGVIDVNDE